jgi:hypothetical protein
MKDVFIELRTTEGQTIVVRKTSIGAIEVSPATTHVEGHLKIYVGGQKFLVAMDKKDLINQLNE